MSGVEEQKLRELSVNWKIRKLLKILTNLTHSWVSLSHLKLYACRSKHNMQDPEKTS